jgi:hypothetical protein
MRWMNAQTDEALDDHSVYGPPGSVTLFTDVNFGGKRWEYSEPAGLDSPPIGLPGHDEVSSLVITGPTTKWLAFWESINNQRGDDALWICQIPANWVYMLPNLHTGVGKVQRPHGNNIWGDVIDGFTWLSSPPVLDHQNRTIHWPNGYQVGNGFYWFGRGIGFTRLLSDGTLMDLSTAIVETSEVESEKEVDTRRRDFRPTADERASL